MRSTVHLYLKALAAMVALGLSSCAPSVNHLSGAAAHAPPAAAVSYRFIYVVHGDAGYIYHDTSGVRHVADAEAVNQARFVAAHAPEAEVFIFHQLGREKHWFHPVTDGLMYHYRNGFEVEKLAYSRDPDRNDFHVEAELLRRHASPSLAGSDPMQIFLYFGHEIPIRETKGYSRSLPGQIFSLADFTRGLQHFAGTAGLVGSSGLADPTIIAHKCDSAKGGAPTSSDLKPFSLIVLSACHGGTPALTQALVPFTPWLLASPGELHLSFLDTRPLTGQGSSNVGVNMDSSLAAQNASAAGATCGSRARAWGEGIARASFARLERTTETAVTLSLYDMDKASAYLHAHENAWMTTGNVERLPGSPYPLFKDCADNAGFGAGGAEAGVVTYYRPAQFGADKNRSAYSGWECPQKPSLTMSRSR